MVLDKKRKAKGEVRNKDSHSTKRKKGSADDDDRYSSQSEFTQLCSKAGLTLKNGNKYNVLSLDQAVFQKNLQKELRLSADTQIVEHFVEGFQEYIEDPNRFHKSLLPCVTDPACDSARSGLQASLSKLLLGLDSIQTRLMTVLLEKLPEFMGDEDSCIYEQGQKVNVPHLLLSQFQWLDRIVNSKEVTDKMLEMVSVTYIDIQREIITCLPDVVQDTEHAHVAKALRDVLQDNSRLTVPVLDALSNLILRTELMAEIRESVLESLVSVDVDDLPVVIKFLLQSVTSTDAVQVISELRSKLEFDAATTSSQALNRQKRKHADSNTNKDTDTLILETINFAVRFQKNVGDAWIKVLEAVKQPHDHKVLDIFLLLILHGTTRRKAVESLVRNKIRAACFTEAYLKRVYTGHSHVLKEYFPTLLRLAEVLLRSPEPPVTHFSAVLYGLTFATFDAYHRQEVVGNLVTHIGSGVAIEVDAALEILADLVDKHLATMVPFAILVKGVLDYLDELSVCQIRKLYFMLSALAFKSPQGGGAIEDDLHIVIRKQLSNSALKYKRMGVIGAVMVVSSIAYHSSESRSECTPPDLTDDLYKQVVALLQLVRTSSNKSPEAYSLFMDELSAVLASRKLSPKVEAWISENLTPDFQDSFVVDTADKVTSELPCKSVYGLDDDAEGSIAINLLPLVIQKYKRRTALAIYLESGVTDPLCLSPSVRLLRVCEERQSGNLENIDALLGCPLYLPQLEVTPGLAQKDKEIVCSSIFYCINWLIEMVNGFSSQTDPEIKGKVISRLQNITQLQQTLVNCLTAYPSFKPPLANFDLDDSKSPIVAAPVTKGEGKKKTRKGKRTVGKKKGAEKDKVTSDSDESSRESTTQLESTTVESQVAPTQDGDDGEGKDKDKDKDKPSVNLANYKPYFRELDISVFTILNTGLITRAALDTEMNTKAVTELSIQAPQLQFLLEDLCRKLSHSLLASSSKRKTFLKTKGDKKVGFSNLDQLSPLQVATKVTKLLPALCNHLEGASGFFQTMMAENDGVRDGPGSHSPEALLIGSCFQLLLQSLLSIFSWNGFEMLEHRDLLKEGLRVLVGRIKSIAGTQLTFMDSIRTAMQYVENFANTVPDIYSAVTILKLMISLADKADSAELTKKLAPFSEELLKREWSGPDGEREKGAKFNEQLQLIIKKYIVYSEDPLAALENIATKAIPQLLDADKQGSSELYPTMTRSSYPVYYRVMFSELIEAVKSIPASKSTESTDVWMERLLKWNVAVRILHILVNLIKAFDGRSNIGTCIKYGRLFVDMFLRLGMPLLDSMFRSHRTDIQGLLKNLQISTRALHHMCGHSKIVKDMCLTNQVPMMKRSLEGFVYRVKAMLTVNKCLEAFWLGNLKNRDLQGEEILSQSTMSETATTQGGEDSDEDAAPDDDDDESDVELDNQSNESNETGAHDVTDAEASYSQVY